MPSGTKTTCQGVIPTGVSQRTAPALVLSAYIGADSQCDGNAQSFLVEVCSEVGCWHRVKPGATLRGRCTQQAGPAQLVGLHMQLITLLFCDDRVPCFLLLPFLAVRGAAVTDLGLPVSSGTAELPVGGRSQRWRKKGADQLAAAV